MRERKPEDTIIIWMRFTSPLTALGYLGAGGTLRSGTSRKTAGDEQPQGMRRRLQDSVILAGSPGEAEEKDEAEAEAEVEAKAKTEAWLLGPAPKSQQAVPTANAEKGGK
jgi:hypothetical protein